MTFGNSGRDILRGPGSWNADLSLAKDFRIRTRLSERFKVGLRSDFSNVFNHPNFGQPNASFGSAAVGTIKNAPPATKFQKESGLIQLYDPDGTRTEISPHAVTGPFADR